MRERIVDVNNVDCEEDRSVTEYVKIFSDLKLFLFIYIHTYILSIIRIYHIEDIENFNFFLQISV